MRSAHNPGTAGRPVLPSPGTAAIAPDAQPLREGVPDPLPPSSPKGGSEEGRVAGRAGRRLQVSAHQPLSRSLLVTGFPYDIRTNPDNNIARFTHFAVRARAVRRLGSAALDLAYVAAGRFDGYWETRLNPWDVAAGVLMVREANGRVTDYDDDPVPVPTTGLVASNGLIHAEMLAVIRMGDSAPRP
jgi:fructose-1,6-bisphosphatase/inositol monophosphatase family enzyme